MRARPAPPGPGRIKLSEETQSLIAMKYSQPLPVFGTLRGGGPIDLALPDSCLPCVWGWGAGEHIVPPPSPPVPVDSVRAPPAPVTSRQALESVREGAGPGGGGTPGGAGTQPRDEIN